MQQLSTRYEYPPIPIRTISSHRQTVPVRAPMFTGVPGGSWGNEASRTRSGYASFLLHVIAISAALVLSSLGAKEVRTQKVVPEHVTLLAPSKDVYMLPAAQQEAGGGGGGG